MKKALLIFLFSSFFLMVPAALKRLTCGFRLAKLRIETPFRSDWEIQSTLSKEDLLSLLSQPFSYLDRGAQCYVFESLDKHTVIKLFRCDQEMRKIEKLFAACRVAYEEASEETGLLHLHLNLTSGELPPLRATGPIGQRLSLPLDRYRFAIQKKAKPFRASLEEAFSNPELLKKRIDSFLSLLDSRLAKGIGNSDPSLSRNFGFLGERAVEIDFGNYYRGSSTNEKARYVHRLRRFLKKKAPERAGYVDDR